MSSPYSSNLLQQSSTEAPPRPQVGAGVAAPQHVRSVTHVVPQPSLGHVPGALTAPVPYYAPQPVVAAPRGGGAAGAVASSLVLGLIVILVGAVALIGGYFAMRSTAPTAAEASSATLLGRQSGYEAGRQRGIAQGRSDGANAIAQTAQLKAGIARQKAYDAAYDRGMSAGSRSYHPRRYYGGYGYRGPRYSFPYGGSSEVTQALGSAQAIANATGAPVDVQVFN